MTARWTRHYRGILGARTVIEDGDLVGAAELVAASGEDPVAGEMRRIAEQLRDQGRR